MISLNDVLLAMSNIPVDDPIAEIWGRGLQGGHEIVEYTGPLPITITADGNALLDYRIYGNTVQSGTPTPENPIMPEGVGEKAENLFDINEITECSVGTISRNGIEYTDIGYYTITAFGTLNGWCYVRVLNGDNIVSTAYLIVPKQLTPIKINLSVGQRLVIYDANPGTIEGSTSLFEQWKPVILYSNSSQPEYPSSYVPYGYKLPMTVVNGNTAQAVPVYIGENQLDAGEYVSYSDGKIYRIVDGTLIPTDPPVPLPDIPTIDGTTIIDYDGDPKPSQMYVKYKGKG